MIPIPHHNPDRLGCSDRLSESLLDASQDPNPANTRDTETREDGWRTMSSEASLMGIRERESGGSGREPGSAHSAPNLVRESMLSG